MYKKEYLETKSISYILPTSTFSYGLPPALKWGEGQMVKYVWTFYIFSSFRKPPSDFEHIDV